MKITNDGQQKYFCKLESLQDPGPPPKLQLQATDQLAHIVTSKPTVADQNGTTEPSLRMKEIGSVPPTVETFSGESISREVTLDTTTMVIIKLLTQKSARKVLL